MADVNKYPYVSVTYKSRFLYRTDAEYREALGVSLETVSKNRYSRHDMDVYYGILNRRAGLFVDKPLDDLVYDYLRASELYLTLDWGGRAQMASRKRFCRRLYRQYATGGRELTADEVVKFKVQDGDERLVRAFFPDGFGGEPAADVSWIVLFAYGVVRPWHADHSRGRDISDEEAMESLARLRSLVETLRADMLRLGSTEKPLAFDEWLHEIDDRMASGDIGKCCALWMATVVMTITDACRRMSDVHGNQHSTEAYGMVSAPGIWVDDADGGESRFWIFPANNAFAFCYRRDGVAWEMHPYEFLVRPLKREPGRCSIYIFDCRDDLEYTFAGARPLDNGRICHCACRFEGEGAPARMTLEEEALPLPAWLGWRRWERLSAADPRHGEFLAVLGSVYDPRSPHSALLRNLVPEITDSVDNLAARDRRYLYVYDWQPKRFRIRESEPDVFVYERTGGHDAMADALFELEVSGEHPLYVIPVDMGGRRYGHPQLDRMAEIMTIPNNVTSISIMHWERAEHPRLVIPAYGFSIALDMEVLSRAGIRRFEELPR